MSRPRVDECADLLAGLIIAALITAVALCRPRRTDRTRRPPRVIVGTLMFAVIYLAPGADLRAMPTHFVSLDGGSDPGSATYQLAGSVRMA